MALARKVTVPVAISGIWQRDREEEYTHNMTFDLFDDGDVERGARLLLRDASSQSGVTAIKIEITDLEEVLHELGYTYIKLVKEQ